MLRLAALVQVLEGFLHSLSNATFLHAVDVVRVITGDAAGFEGAFNDVSGEPLPSFFHLVSHEGVRGLPAGVKSVV